VTGANGGLGLETTKALADRGAHVVMAVRNQAKATGAVDEIRAESQTASLEVVPLDLASVASVRAAAERVPVTRPRVDILVNNASVMAMPERRTEDGFEMQPEVLRTDMLPSSRWCAAQDGGRRCRADCRPTARPGRPGQHGAGTVLPAEPGKGVGFADRLATGVVRAKPRTASRART
jgi:NAD(P)-dependent dehydrogenase (short-subunit alcohol dehydrogenase family)